MYGPFGDPQREGSMAVFTSREAAEEFAEGDPFVLNGVVRRLAHPRVGRSVRFRLVRAPNAMRR